MHFITKICGKRPHSISKALKVTKENTIIVIIVSNIFMQNEDFSF